MTVSDAGGGAAALALKLTNNARIVANQMRIAKLQELTGKVATANGCSAIVATTVMPHPNFPALRQLHSILVSRYSDRGDEAVAASGDVDDKAIPILTVTQRATQR